MTLKTLSDCTRCPYLTDCDAHITEGTHKHQEGSDPCKLDLNPMEDGMSAVEKGKI